MNEKSKIDMKSLAHLSRLYLSNDELSAFESDMEDMIAFVSRLDTDLREDKGTEYAPHSVCRSDIPSAEFSKDDLLSVAPKAHDGFFAVPKVVD